MQQLKLFLLCGGAILTVIVLFNVLFSVSPSPASVIDVEQGAQAPSGGGISSSLNLIVRVSPRLAVGKKMTSASLASSSAPVVENNTLYQPYRPGISFTGQSTLLFFSQSNDPFSLEHEDVLHSFAASGKLRIRTYRIDFNNTSMKLQYGVVVPDTFILLDATGQRIQSIIHPSEAELRLLLTSNPR